jgi:predicted metal-binding membrane protein
LILLTQTWLDRDRLIVGSGLISITALGWAYLVYDVQTNHCARMMGPAASPWTLTTFTTIFAMWTIMMIAMMVPSAAPMLLTFAAVNTMRQKSGRRYVPTSVFLVGYLIVWSAFSVLATIVQWALQRTALLNGTFESGSRVLTGVILIAAGGFQFTPLKNRCLTHCHMPFQFITTQWREGHAGALAMGLRHGAYCVGCCWAIMALLFVAGVMNLWWIAVLSIFVLAEKLSPRFFSRPLGSVLVFAGVWFLIRH